jgi:hypothetical protein
VGLADADAVDGGGEDGVVGVDPGDGADAGERLGGGRAGVPVGQVAGDRDLEGAEHADVEVAAAHHPKESAWWN